jgi:hypothetical protein
MPKLKPKKQRLYIKMAQDFDLNKQIDDENRKRLLRLRKM